ncbi:hypothetical protein [Acidihalobacter prosperus]
MVEVVLGITLILSLAGSVLLWHGWRHLAARHLLRAGAHGGVGMTLITAASVAGFAALDLAGYQQLTAERPVAMIRFKSVAPSGFVAYLKTTDGRIRHYRLHGQDWRLDARVLKWRSWAYLLGFKPLYRLTRLSGRYATVAGARSHLHTVYALGDVRGLDVWQWSRRLHLAFVDAVYGSSVYLPMAAGAKYRIRLGVTGLIARPVNTAARQAVDAWR